jgi:hypothetical protein
VYHYSAYQAPPSLVETNGLTQVPGDRRFFFLFSALFFLFLMGFLSSVWFLSAFCFLNFFWIWNFLKFELFRFDFFKMIFKKFELFQICTFLKFDLF